MGMSIFEIIGPVMVGPSSSHTAGMARIGMMANRIINETPREIHLELSPKLKTIYAGHKSDAALFAGTVGMHEDDPKIKDAVRIVNEMGIKTSVDFLPEGSYPENTAKITVITDDKKSYSVTGTSIGGGSIIISAVDDAPLNISPAALQIIVWSKKALCEEILRDLCGKFGKYELSFGLSSKGEYVYAVSFKNQITSEQAEKLNKCAEQKNTIVKVHIKVDTGMGRVGLIATDSSEFEKDIEVIKNIKELKHIEIEGIYSHLASPDAERDYTNKQISLFDSLITKLAQENIDIKYRHILASTGITDYTYACYNMVRPGIIMYGHTSRGKEQTKLDLKPCTKLLSKVAYIKNVPENTSISYGRTYITRGYTKIATVPMGYADGIRRELSNKAYVCINEIKAPIIGVVCMDNFMVDVSKVPNVKVGDDVAIWDNENITLEEVASKCDTIVHDILCGITNRVDRVYTKYVNHF